MDIKVGKVNDGFVRETSHSREITNYKDLNNAKATGTTREAVSNETKNRVTLYIIGESRTNVENAITKTYGSFFIAMEVDAATGEIVDFGVTHTLKITENFLRKIFIGKSLITDYDQLVSEVSRRYGGSSQKAVLVSLRDAKGRFQVVKDKLNI